MKLVVRPPAFLISSVFLISPSNPSISSSLACKPQIPTSSSMASITMAAASFTAGTCAAVSRRAPVNRRGVVMATLAEPAPKVESSSSSSSADKSRRNVMFAAAAAAVCSVAYGNQASMAAGELKPGTPEAKKFYAPICVTMPTARVCHK
ncbi:hypothetical protein ACLOJK_016083 [Asimina triloba]